VGEHETGVGCLLAGSFGLARQSSHESTELIIRAPKDYHVGKQWHPSNETITVIRGTFVVGHDGSEQRWN
jgi:hypothetical protein